MDHSEIRPAAGVRWLDKDSPAGRQAVAEFNAVVGYDIRVVFEGSWWGVGQVGDHRPDVLLTADGVRAMARFAPRPDAADVAERVIADGRAQR